MTSWGHSHHFENPYGTRTNWTEPHSRGLTASVNWRHLIEQAAGFVGSIEQERA